MKSFIKYFNFHYLISYICFLFLIKIALGLPLVMKVKNLFSLIITLIYSFKVMANTIVKYANKTKLYKSMSMHFKLERYS